MAELAATNLVIRPMGQWVVMDMGTAATAAMDMAVTAGMDTVGMAGTVPMDAVDLVADKVAAAPVTDWRAIVAFGKQWVTAILLAGIPVTEADAAAVARMLAMD